MLAQNDAPLVSVIILNYNGNNYLENCISSVLKTSYPNFEVILVDNASTDLSLTRVKEAFGNDARLKIIENPVNLGFSGGNNVGFNYSQGDYIAFLNNDTIVDSEWLTHLVNALQNDETIGLAQSMILTINGEKIQTAGWLFSDYLVLLHGLAKDKTSGLELKPVFEVPVASGTSMMVRRALINEVGLFDSSIPFFYDDTFLSFKVWLVNKRVVTVADSRIRHIGGAASAWNIQFTSYNFLKAKICLVFDVYYKFDELAKALFVNFFSLSVNSLFVLRKKNFAAVFANFNALVWGLRSFKFLWKNRLKHWAKTKISPDSLKEKFVRVKLPVPFYLMPSKLGNDCFAFEVGKYENALMRA